MTDTLDLDDVCDTIMDSMSADDRQTTRQYQDGCGALADMRSEIEGLRARAAEQVKPETVSCWHCLDVLISELNLPRCDRCPAECDDENCAAEGCVLEREANPGVCPSGRKSKADPLRPSDRELIADVLCALSFPNPDMVQGEVIHADAVCALYELERRLAVRRG